MSSGVSVNRELSRLELNRRFLKDAQDPTLPLLERVKRLATFQREPG
jgi:polyphosphate kinase